MSELLESANNVLNAGKVRDGFSYEDFRALPRQTQLDVVVDLSMEWLDAHPKALAEVYHDPQLLDTWCLFAGGMFIGAYFKGDPNPHNIFGYCAHVTDQAGIVLRNSEPV